MTATIECAGCQHLDRLKPIEFSCKKGHKPRLEVRNMITTMVAECSDRVQIAPDHVEAKQAISTDLQRAQIIMNTLTVRCDLEKVEKARREIRLELDAQTKLVEGIHAHKMAQVADQVIVAALGFNGLTGTETINKRLAEAQEHLAALREKDEALTLLSGMYPLPDDALPEARDD